MEKLSLTFDGAWVLSKKEDAVLPVDAVVAHLKNTWDVAVLESSLTECEVVVKTPEVTAAMIYSTVADYLKKTYDLEIDGKQVSISVVTFEGMVSEDPATDAETNNRIASVTRLIDHLIGAEDFKALASEMVAIAPNLIANEATDVFTHQCYLMAINDGNGLTTYLKCMVALTEALGLFKFSESGQIIEEKIAPPSKESSNPFDSVIHALKRGDSRRAKLVCLDISEWMNKTGDKVFRDFLANVEDLMGKHMFVFRVPFVEKEILANLNASLSDRLFVRTLSFVPFNNEELSRYAEQTLSERGFTLEPGVLELISDRLTEEKNDGRFYGINTVNKVIRELLYRKQLQNATTGVNDKTVRVSELAGLVADADHREKTGMELLDGMIGMEPLRQRVEEIVAQIQAALGNESLGSPCIHMRFVGNPGTGKTTVARVIGKILKEKGILRNGNFFEHSGRDFCGRYVGETAPKTAAMCRDAYGSVLFIDEAYSLYRGEGHSTVDYGREAIDTLIAEMENHRSDLVVIMAGYPDDMASLMQGNAGLESRMPYVIEFPNYTREQLAAIFMQMVNKSFTPDAELEAAVRAYFDAIPEGVITAKEFSNARFVRNLFERTWGKAVLRSQLNKVPCTELTKEDFMLASGEKEFKDIMGKTGRIALGFA